MTIAGRLQHSILEIILLVLCIVLTVVAPGFFTMENILNVLRNVSMQGIIALGMTAVIIAGEIDLSVGSAVAFAGCWTAYLTGRLTESAIGMPPGIAVPVAMFLAICTGCALGGFAGIIRTRFGVPSFISTLALMTGLSGAAELITNGFPLTPFPAWYNSIGGGYLLGVPVPALVFIAVFVAMQFLMSNTTFGRAVYAVGGNPEAARLSGIHANRVKIIVLALTSTFAALAGIMQSSEIMSGTATTAKGWELDVIAAVIIGGTSLTGGAGTIRGTMVGMIFLGVMINGLTLLNVNEYWQHVVRGALILCAVLINRVQTQRALARSAGGRS
jgi:ribose/xylose/arabinose/galactoside ABC-type transport system permease subunit